MYDNDEWLISSLSLSLDSICLLNIYYCYKFSANIVVYRIAFNMCYLYGYCLAADARCFRKTKISNYFQSRWNVF